MPNFYETQIFRQKWLMFLMIIVNTVVLTVFLYSIVQQVILGKPWGNSPVSNTVLIAIGCVSVFSCLAISYLIWTTKLTTEVNDTGVHIRFYPFLQRHVHFDSITDCQEKRYNPILEYGGWGLRFGLKSNAYNVSGNKGVFLEFKKGKSLLIGSQRADELAHAIQARLPSSDPS